MVGNRDETTWRDPGRDVDRFRIQRPASRRPGYNRNFHLQQRQVTLRVIPDWAKDHDLVFRLNNLPVSTRTWDIFRNFSEYGNVVYIEIFEGRDGARDGSAKIKFCPPPHTAFWESLNSLGIFPLKDEDGVTTRNCRVEMLLNKRRGRLEVTSPIKKHIKYSSHMKLIPTEIHFGIMENPETMMTMQVIHATPGDETSLEMNLIKHQLVATFIVDFVDPRSTGDTTYVSESRISKYNRRNKYKFQIPFSYLKNVHCIDIDEYRTAFLISLEYPPQFYRKQVDLRGSHTDENRTWTEMDSWYRSTDIVYDPYPLEYKILALHKEQPVIDIGRWTTYKFILDKRQNSGPTYWEIRNALQDFNIETITLDKLDMVLPRKAEVWSLIDLHHSHTAAAEYSFLDGDARSTTLPFSVRYQLEVCISREILNEYNLTREFIVKLANIASDDPAKAQFILEYVAELNKRIYDPMSIFDNVEALAYSPKSEIPPYCAYARKATITPTTIYFNSPTVEITNRVLRHYAHENSQGRFLRVQFTDELAEGGINASADRKCNDELYTRVYRTLFNGIRIGDRHYKFLAFGNSQFRENGAYFYCETPHVSCNHIRAWMGNFSHISVVAKYAARLGQCFSTTRAINGLSKPDIVKIDDIERDGFCFTDGVGKISPFLAQMITVDLGLRVKTAPSAFQFRLGGCKGVLAVSTDAKDKEVHIRRSQQKFTAIYNGLEIIRWSRFSLATLNRQTITILSSLGVPDEVFLKMLTEQLSSYQSAMSDNALAQSLLVKYIDDNQMTINIATMINNGFMTENEPFVLSLLHLWRSWSIKLLKEKAKIIVENGAFLLGVVDETATLRGHVTPSVAPGEECKVDELPQIFVQVPSKHDPNQYNVIEGICLVGRNPSLHPGDLRVVQAVNVKALHHLRDVVVFPQTGERDIPSMCSGGDLDGDDFFVIWDKDLQPPEWNPEPMNCLPPKPVQLGRAVEVTDTMKFFVRFMKNDALPTIAHAHLALSDRLEKSVKDPKCLELAALHSRAVDYMKTGQAAQLPKRLRPTQWPHFMEKKHKRDDQKYKSTKILGQLYDKVESVNFIPQYEKPFDKRILRAYSLEDSMLKTVRQTKSQYDTAMRRILAQYEINTEFEVWSTFVLSRPRVGSDYKVQEEMARISDALKDRFRQVCIEKAGGKDFAKLGPFVAGMYKVTKEELDIAIAECRTTKIVAGVEIPKRKMEPRFMPLISFPWLFEKELGRIATGVESTGELEEMLPTLGLKAATRNRAGGVESEIKDFIEFEDGYTVHRGELLDLFRRDDDDIEHISEDSDFGEVRSVADYRDREDYMQGENSETVLKTEFTLQNTPSHLHGGTGVEEVVPRIELDGLIDLSEPHHTTSNVAVGRLFTNTLTSDIRDIGTRRIADSDPKNRLSGSSFEDLALLDGDSYANISLEEGESIEVEEVELEVPKSALEKLQELMAS